MVFDQARVIIENIAPAVNCGRFAVKAVTGEYIPVSADVIGDGHDIVAASVRYKHEKERKWRESRLSAGANDYWHGGFTVDKQGNYRFKIEAWVDHGLNWQHGIGRKLDDGQYVRSELLEGAELIKPMIKKASDTEKGFLRDCMKNFQEDQSYERSTHLARSDKLRALFVKYPVQSVVNQSEELPVYVDRLRARFSTWYELFPRSAASEPGAHGTFKDCHRLLPRISKMGFDVLYFPPVHPIGEVNRKGKNNTTQALEGDVGSPWGIGSHLGGHKDIHPDLGSLDDFKAVVKAAREHGLEVAMDFALQAAPDHPWVKSHPEWFKWRPDGTVQYAENPPKKYQDILPIYFESDDWKNLWKEMLDTALYWVRECGIRIFRVDNPHTKPFYFWGWLIAQVKKEFPDVLFLSEAFTRPKVMQQLAKQGFTQSYTYFTWRNSKQELIEYVEQLTQSDDRLYFRPNFWPNTPDINPWSLQGGNEAIHLSRYFLAATLSSNTGVYGPVFEQMESAALPGREEYLDSEKFQVRYWDWEKENKVTTLMTKINHSRKANPSLQQTNNIRFLHVENDQLLAYYKYDQYRENETLMVVNLDPYYAQSGWVQLPLDELGVPAGAQVRVHDQITGSSYIWDREWNFVELHPALPFHLFKIEK